MLWKTPQERAFDLLVRVWTRALLERFRVPPSPIQVGVVDFFCVAVITVASGLGEVPAKVLSEVYDFVRRPSQRLTREQEDALRLLARGWLETLRGCMQSDPRGGFRWVRIDLKTALPTERCDPMRIPEIRVPAEILAASFGIPPAELLEVFMKQQIHLFGAAISCGPKEPPMWAHCPANDPAA